MLTMQFWLVQFILTNIVNVGIFLLFAESRNFEYTDIIDVMYVEFCTSCLPFL